MEVNQCPKCNKIFANKSTYNIHAKTSKCGNNNNNTINNKEKENNFLCSYCSKSFSSNQMLSYHKTICTEKKIHDIKTQYETEISNLHQHYKKIIEGTLSS